MLSVNIKAVLLYPLLQHAESTPANQGLLYHEHLSIRFGVRDGPAPVEYSGQCMLCMLELIVQLKGEGKRFLHGDLICTYTLSAYISDIYVDGLCIISVKINSQCLRLRLGVAIS